MNDTPGLSPSQDFEHWLADLALAVTVYCARNTVIENYHAGKAIRSKTGDFSDVMVITPYGEIPWNRVSRVSDEEMKAFNIEVSNKIFTTLQYLLNPAFEAGQEEFVQRLSYSYPTRWNRPIMQKLQSPKVRP